MDENKFFREAALRICGNLEIEEALISSLNFLRERMPVDRILLQLYEEGLNAMRTVAIATPTKANAIDLLTHLTPEAREKKRKKGTGMNVTNLRLNVLRKSISLPKQTHPGPSGHPSQEGTTPRLLRSPPSQEGNLKTQYCVLSHRY